MNGIDLTKRPMTLAESDITDMIDALKISENAPGTCKEHGLQTRSQILTHRVQQQTLYDLAYLKSLIEALVQSDAARDGIAVASTTINAAHPDAVYDEHTPEFKFNIFRFINGDFKNFGVKEICTILVVIFALTMATVVGRNYFKMQALQDSLNVRDVKVQALQQDLVAVKQAQVHAIE